MFNYKYNYLLHKVCPFRFIDRHTQHRSLCFSTVFQIACKEPLSWCSVSKSQTKFSLGSLLPCLLLFWQHLQHSFGGIFLTGITIQNFPQNLETKRDLFYIWVIGTGICRSRIILITNVSSCVDVRNSSVLYSLQWGCWHVEIW